MEAGSRGTASNCPHAARRLIRARCLSRRSITVPAVSYKFSAPERLQTRQTWDRLQLRMTHHRRGCLHLSCQHPWIECFRRACDSTSSATRGTKEVLTPCEELRLTAALALLAGALHPCGPTAALASNTLVAREQLDPSGGQRPNARSGRDELARAGAGHRLTDGQLVGPPTERGVRRH